MRWLRFWTDREEFRPRRAYFRPTDRSELDVALVPLIDRLVTVRFVKVAGADSPFGGQRLYDVVEQGTSGPKFVRPERDFDFLE
jgi:hypothetical protein